MINIKRKMILTLALSSFLILAACSGEGNKEVEGTGEAIPAEEKAYGEKEDTLFPLTITHDLGEVVLEEVPENIVVFDYGVLDMLQNLEIPVKGLPKKNLPAFLEEYKNDRYTNVGSLKEPDFETIYEMSPDVIIISGRASGAYEELSKIAPTIYMAIDANDYMGSLGENSALLGEIFQKEEIVEEKMKALKGKASQIKEDAVAKEMKALIMLTNDGSISAYGQNSRFGIIHNTLGFMEVDESIETSTHGQNISFEYILEKNPENIFVIDRAVVTGGEIKASSTLENDLVKETKAYQEGNIFYLDPETWYLATGGFTGTELMLDEVVEALK